MTHPVCILSENEVCVERGSYRGKFATSVTAIFKNGSFHGPGRVVFEDGSTLISDFKNGTPAGSTRRFDKNGKLMEIYFENIMPKGYKWVNFNDKYLFYSDVSSFLNNHNDAIGETNISICKFKCTSVSEGKIS